MNDCCVNGGQVDAAVAAAEVAELLALAEAAESVVEAAAHTAGGRAGRHPQDVTTSDADGGADSDSSGPVSDGRNGLPGSVVFTFMN